MTPELRYVWTDIETTGLDPKVDRILEIASIITDGDLNEMARYHAVVPYHTDALRIMRSDADPYVQAMHDETGLWEKCASDEDIDHWAVVGDEFTSFITTHATAREHYRLAGSSVHFDHKFLMEEFPWAMALLTHRVLDVSTLMHFANENYGLPWFEKAGTHEAMTDIVESMEEYRYIRDSLGLKP